MRKSVNIQKHTCNLISLKYILICFIPGKSRNTEKDMQKMYSIVRVSDYQSFVYRNIVILER